AVANADQYELQWATNSAFTLNLQTTLVAAPTTTLSLPTPPDSPGTLYYRRVRTRNALGVPGPFSAARSFTLDTSAPDAPTLLMPAQDALTSNSRPTLSWRAVPGASAYLLDIATDSDFSNLLLTNEVITRTSYLLPTSLPQGTYYWRVQAQDAALNIGSESSASPAPRHFTINILTAPLNNAILTAASGNAT